ncbi:KIF16B [Symbiodinium natans]|uniref:KIF16B protein n=1 Tax=Symbiodinium natans TaxID=878477 RepID=A0A812ICN1_9DINO|nr:KIF16B [Symbiodinium natans]
MSGLRSTSSDAPVQPQYKVKFIGNTADGGHTTYIIQVSHVDGSSWNLQRRYRALRELHDELKLRYGENLPHFPAKRFFGNNDPAFIASRQVALEQYITGVLAIEPEVKTPVLRKFLGGPMPSPEQSPSRHEREIMEGLEAKLLNFALPPTPIDEAEMAERKKKYKDSMRLSVMAQPVDPVILRDLGLDEDPAPALCKSAGSSGYADWSYQMVHQPLWYLIPEFH